MGVFSDVWDSFKMGKAGLSGRKMAAFWAITIVATGLSISLAYSVHKKPDSALMIYLVYVIIAWLLFGSVCLGLVAIPELIKFLAELKNGKPKSESTDTTADNSAATTA